MNNSSVKTSTFAFVWHSKNEVVCSHASVHRILKHLGITALNLNKANCELQARIWVLPEIKETYLIFLNFLPVCFRYLETSHKANLLSRCPCHAILKLRKHFHDLALHKLIWWIVFSLKISSVVILITKIGEKKRFLFSPTNVWSNHE